MKTRKLGNSDLEVSVLGMGCWQYGGGKYWGAQDQKDVDQVVHKALDLGINFFDTAEVYNDGDSEISLGIALKGKREQALIANKINTASTRAAELREHCDASLKRLQTDYIDLYMLHWPLTPQSVKHFSENAEKAANIPTVEEVFGTLRSLQQEGKIRHIGISNHGVKQMQEVLNTGVTIAANELIYSLFSRAIEDSVLPYCVKHDIGIIGYMPLQQGLLTGKYQSLDEVKPMLARTRHFHHSRGEGTRHGEEGAEAEINQAMKDIRDLAGELDVQISVLSLAWAIANPKVATTIVGCRNLAQLEENVQGATYSLSNDVLARLEQITNPVLQKLGYNPDFFESTSNSRVY